MASILSRRFRLPGLIWDLDYTPLAASAGQEGPRRADRVAELVGLEDVVGGDGDDLGVELRAGRRGQDRRRGAGRVRVHDQHGLVRVVGRGEHEDVGEVEAAVVAGETFTES